MTTNTKTQSSASVSALASSSRFLDRIHHADCLELLPQLPAHSVDMVFADLPYGVTRSRWDLPIPLDQLWVELKRVIKPGGAVVMTATQPFTSLLVMSNLAWFKYDQVWVKTIASNQMNVRHQPLRKHESVLVFYGKRGTYNPQLTVGEPYTVRRKAGAFENTYGAQRDHVTTNDGIRHPTTVLSFPNARVAGAHSAAKPVELVEHFIKTFTNPSDVVLDPVVGGGSTAVAAIRTGRHFIGMEQDARWANYAQARVAAERTGAAA